ncbi:ABC transporter permease [Streptomyces coffeae]|uniref:ABC transporter permease n=1 Tax=Streptomyces coffeae TaxID=621382 RepID=A0ABS1NPH3_9ACTN|nr:ABC transporter permease [Streptomyces coffeae]MBL1101973.1 ABC transporter permease [Streptomyces coffeae]
MQPRFADAVAFEWIKMRSIRSTWWTLAAAACISIGIGMIGGREALPQDTTAFVMEKILVGLSLGQMAICVFGVLTATSEYGTGSIRSTFTAVPDRLRLLAAKALVVFTVSLVAGTAIVFATFAAGTLTLGSGVPVPSLSEDAVLRALVGGGCYLALLGVFSLALGLVLRASAGGITAAVSITFILPTVFHMLGDALLKWWPTQAGRQILQVSPSSTDLAPVPGLCYFAVTTVVALVVAMVLTNRRDA